MAPAYNFIAEIVVGLILCDLMLKLVLQGPWDWWRDWNRVKGNPSLGKIMSMDIDG